jgi:DNA-binding NarL/FixJ family response regulator
MDASIRVQICDDSQHVRFALRRLVEAEPDLIVASEAASAAEAICQIRDQRPDVLLLDVSMPGCSGFDAIPELLAASPRTRILMLSLHDSPAYSRHAFAAGAHGYLVKDSVDEIVQAIHDVARGGTPPSTAGVLAHLLDREFDEQMGAVAGA